MMIVALLVAASLPAPPERGRFVLDAAQVLAPEDYAQLERLSGEVDRSGVGQLAIVTTRDLYGRADRKELAVELFKAWGIGHKLSRGRDDGVLILLKVDQPERGVKVEVGYDLEGRLNDGKVGALARAAVPHFQAGRWGAGLLQLAGGVAAEMHAEGSAPLKAADDVSTGTIVAIVMGLVLLALLAFWIVVWRRKPKRAPFDTPRESAPPLYVPPSPLIYSAPQAYEAPPVVHHVHHYDPPPAPTYTAPASDPSPSWDSGSSSSSSDSSSSWGSSDSGSSGGGGFDGGSSGGGGSDTSF